MLAVSFMWIFVGVNLFGVKTGGRVQVVTSLLKLVPLVLVLVVGAVSIISSPGTYTPNLPTTPLTTQLSMGAAAVALYAMLGFESAAVAASRVTNPEKTIPRATLIGTLLVATFYVAIVAIGMLVVPQATLATSNAPFVTIVDHLLGSRQWPLDLALRRDQRARLPERLDAARERADSHARRAPAVAGTSARTTASARPGPR